MKVDYLLYKGEDGWFLGAVPSMPGCFVQGRSADEVEERIREAATLYYSGLKKRGIEPVELVGTREVEIDV